MKSAKTFTLTACIVLLLCAVMLCVYFRQHNSVIVLPSQIVSVYDGDTFTINVPWWPPIIGDNISVRVSGVDTPEIRGSKCKAERDAAYKAKEFVVDVFSKAYLIELKNIQRDKYFRLLADVYVDNMDLSKMLTLSGLAREYHGETKKGWCGNGG